MMQSVNNALDLFMHLQPSRRKRLTMTWAWGHVKRKLLRNHQREREPAYPAMSTMESDLVKGLEKIRDEPGIPHKLEGELNIESLAGQRLHVCAEARACMDVCTSRQPVWDDGQ